MQIKFKWIQGEITLPTLLVSVNYGRRQIYFSHKKNYCSDIQQSVLHISRCKTNAEILKEPFCLQLVDQASTRPQMVLPSVLSAHHTARHMKMVQWTAGVRIIISGQTKTLHPWLVPVSSSAATHAPCLVWFGLSCDCAICFWGVCVFVRRCVCVWSIAHFFLFSICKLKTLCFLLHAWLINHTKMNLFLKNFLQCSTV